MLARWKGNLLPDALAAWTGFMSRHAWLVLALTLLAGVGLGWYAVNHLGVDTDTADMISDRLDWRRDYIEFKQVFPHFSESILVVVDGRSPELAHDAASRLAHALKKRPELFPRVVHLAGHDFFRRNALLFLEQEELHVLADDLVRMQPLIGRLAREPNLAGLANTLSTALGRADPAQSPLLDEFLGEVARAFAAARTGSFFRLSWQSLGQGSNGAAPSTRRLIQVRATLDFDDLMPGRRAIEWIRVEADALGLIPGKGVDVRLTGPVPLMHEELVTVSRGAALAGAVSLVLVTLVLYTALRSFRLMAAALVTLLVGLAGTAAFAALTVGRLNLISVAFAVLYIGLGIDFAIHLGMRHRELLLAGAGRIEALTRPARDVGVSLVICALTTSIGFFAFFPTDFDGVAELGLISGTGMYISLLSTLTVMPAMLTVLPLNVASEQRRRSPPRAVLRLPERHSGKVLAGAVMIGLIAAALLPGMRFDPNPMNLRDPDTESVTVFRELLAESDAPPVSLSVLADGAAQARCLAARLESLDTVRGTRSLEDFVPEAQAAKLPIIRDLALVLGPALQLDATNLDHAQRLKSLATLREALHSAGTDLPGARVLRAELDRWPGPLREDSGGAYADQLARAEANIFHFFPHWLARLRTALRAEPISREDLPRALLEDWVSADGRYRVEVFPREDVLEHGALGRFVSSVRDVAPRVTGIPLVNLYAGKVVKNAFQEAFLLASVVIVALLLVLLRSARDTCLVIGPLALALVLMGAVSVVAGVPWNFANVIALPLLLGMGVDSGIHMVHRARFTRPGRDPLLSTSTARAVLYSGVTTMCSFGNLMLSGHLGMASMGKMLTIGMTMILLATLVVLPAALAWRGAREPIGHAE